MVIPQVEYVGFRSGDTSRDYRLLIRHPDGHCDEFIVAIPQEAFLAHRVRYQDGAEICFLKLRRALETWVSAPDAGLPPARQEVTEADLLAYREVHTAKPRRTGPPATPGPPPGPASGPPGLKDVA